MNEALLAIILALFGLLGGYVANAFAHRHERAQQAREMVLGPSREFAESALSAMAALRHVTPPGHRPNSTIKHRNEALLIDVQERTKRLRECEVQLDRVRVARASARLVLGPGSAAAEDSRQTLGWLRASLEKAAEFYALADQHSDSIDVWRSTAENGVRQQYKDFRIQVYDNLDRYFVQVAEQLHKPSWKKLTANSDRALAQIGRARATEFR